jgi:hypothetical protein
MTSPDELLAGARAAIRSLTAATAAVAAGTDIRRDAAARFEQLDGHMTAGGPPPADWHRASTALPSRDELAAVLAKPGGGELYIPGLSYQETADLIRRELAGGGR